MEKFRVIRNTKYDFAKQSYKNLYPNLHKYPATMIPQIGIELLKELNITKGRLLDPYCGSGSSFTSAVDMGLKQMDGFDINPLAVLISRAKFTKIDPKKLIKTQQYLKDEIYEFLKIKENPEKLKIPNYYNIDFWFSKQVVLKLSTLKHFINKLSNKDIKRFFWIPLSETIRECSYTKSAEFKLYKIKPEEIIHFNPDVTGIYFNKLEKVILIYKNYYFPKLNGTQVHIEYRNFKQKPGYYDIVLTSPPYGDSKTTVAYGQFSMFANEWMGINHARKIDYMLMGGKITKNKYSKGLISDYISKIEKQSQKRALEISSFYFDLEESINEIASSVRKGGTVIYIVGNRNVKGIKLPTDQFIAEKFTETGFKHLKTLKRLLSNKVMPSKNSPTNKKGQRAKTMSCEYIVICEKQK